MHTLLISGILSVYAEDYISESIWRTLDQPMEILNLSSTMMGRRTCAKTISNKMTYLLISPLDGKITFSNYWCVNQNITAGQVVFSVVPKTQSELIGKALLPMERSGKVKIGQRVNIHFLNYPDNENGMVQGIVNRISLIPTEGKYAVEVKFPKGLMTSYGKLLPLSYEMTANADIVTNDMRLIEHFFLPLKRILKENI